MATEQLLSDMHHTLLLLQFSEQGSRQSCDAFAGSDELQRKLMSLQVLRAHGVRVLTVREILAFGVEERIGARVELEELAASTLTYKLAEGAVLTAVCNPGVC